MADSQSWKAATAGTHVDARAPRGAAIAFAVVALALALVPSVGMLWARTDTTTENRELAEAPALFEEDGSFNVDVLSDAGAYFDDHFAYRNEAVTANARLRALLATSATDQVIVGSDGWLYYGGTLPDYLGQNRLSDRSLANIAHNLALAQAYAERQGAAFTFALAPNKNSLDASHMPFYYLPFEGASNFERLKPYLDAAGVNYVDLFDSFAQRMEAGERFGYLKLDSHWDNRWALIAADEMLSSLQLSAVPLDPDAAEVRDDFAGDLQSMLYPSLGLLEDNCYYAGFNDGPGFTGESWSYTEGADVTDSLASTEANAQGGEAAGVAQGNGSLLMFRDSFGNALLPFMAASFESATFSKLVPYNLAQLAQVKADAVIVERAERHLDYLATDPPIMTAPARAGAELPEGAEEAAATVDVTQSGSYWVVSGSVEGPLADTDAVLVEVKGDGAEPIVFDPFWTSAAADDGEVVGDTGYLFYVPSASVDLSQAEIRVLVVR